MDRLGSMNHGYLCNAVDVHFLVVKHFSLQPLAFSLASLSTRVSPHAILITCIWLPNPGNPATTHEHAMKVVILCGGKGSRLREETEFRPKPLLPIGNRPTPWRTW